MECTNWKGEAKTGHACAQDQGTTPTKEYTVQLKYDATPSDDLPDTDAMTCTNWKGEAKTGHACAQDQGTTPTIEYTVQLYGMTYIGHKYDATPDDDKPDTDKMECTNWKGEAKTGHACAQDQGTTTTKEYTR